MITEVLEKRATNARDAELEYDGQWFLLRRDPEDGIEYVVAYGDGSVEDREALHEIRHKRFHGKAFLIKGYYPKVGEILGIY